MGRGCSQFFIDSFCKEGPVSLTSIPFINYGRNAPSSQIETETVNSHRDRSHDIVIPLAVESSKLVRLSQVCLNHSLNALEKWKLLNL